MGRAAFRVRQYDAPLTADSPVTDLRFRALLGADAWDLLPQAVQARFSKRLAGGRTVTYAGTVSECRMSTLGWCLAQLCRVIGAPLPLHRDTGAPAVVTVTEDGASGGQIWSRMYARHRGFPQVIHSAKRFAGPTGLEEYLGGGFGIALTVSADATGIRFRNDHYFWMLGRYRLRLPRWIGPGGLTIDHQDRGRAGFAFILTLAHPLFGTLMQQTGLFQEGVMTDAKEQAQ